MPVLGTQQFLVTNNPAALEQSRISNLSPAGYDPTDRDRLFIHYNSKAGNIELNPTTQIYGSGRANTFGGNYSFDPSADYLNTGWGAQAGQNPLIYRGQGLDRPNTAPQGPGGAIYGDGLRIALPSVSDIPDTSVNAAIQCPYGFYQSGSVCVPGVTLNPNDPNNILGINSNLQGSMGGQNGWGTGQYQDARGVIKRVITPVKTEKGKLFQVVTQVQNIGNSPGKFETKVSIPAIGIQDALSNSIMVSPGQTTTLLHSLTMPTTLPENIGQLIPVQSDLYVTSLKNTNAQPILHYSNTANIPAPGTVLGSPPPTPPIPNIPLPGQGGPQQQPAPYPFPPSMGPRPFPLPFPQYTTEPAIHYYPNQPTLPVGSPLAIVCTGFSPGETVTIQLYSVKDGVGVPKLKEKLKQTTTIAGYNGTTSPVQTTVPKVGGSGGLFGLMGIFSIGGSGGDNDRFAIVAVGNDSNIKKTRIVGISGSGSSNNGFGISIGGSNGINIGSGGISIG